MNSFLKKNSSFFGKFGLPIGLVAILMLMQLFYLDLPLLSFTNISNTLLQNTSIALTALGLSIIMISGEGDMSFAGLYSLLTTIFALIANQTASFTSTFFVVLSITLAINLVLVTLVTRFGFSSFIASIAVMYMAQGVERTLHQQTPLITEASAKSLISIEFGFNIVVWIMLIVYAISYLIIAKTKFGFKLRVTGENAHAAIEAGINIKKMKYLAYIASAVCITMATSFETIRSGAVYNQGASIMLPVFAACYLGSSMFVPGRVNILGTLFGALFVSMLDGFMKMIGLESFLISIIQGFILVVSVAISVWNKRSTITQVAV